MRSTRRVMKLGLFGAALLVGLGGSSVFAQKKPRIAVLPFDSSRISSGYASLSTSIVNGMFETQLVKTGKFTVIERKRIDDVMKEQGLGLSGAVDPTTAVKVGKVLGVELILTGDITELGVKKSGAHGFGIGGSRSMLQGSLDVRLISTQTAEIVFADTAKNQDSSMKLSVFGVGGGVDLDETKIEKVFRPAVHELVGKMANKVDTIVANFRGSATVTGKIAAVTADKIYLTIGGNEGVKVGDAFDVYRQGQEIRDPDTGAVLDVEMKLIGKVLVTQVKDKVSIATSQSGSGFKKGDIVKPPKS